MAVAVRASAGYSTSPTLPTYQANDLLILHVVAKQSLSGYAPDGWTQMLASQGGGGSQVVWYEAVLWKVAGSSETAPAVPAGVEYCFITSFSGVDPGQPIRKMGALVTAITSSGTNGSLGSESFQGGDLLFTAFAGASGNNVNGAWSNEQIGGRTMTETYDQTAVDGVNFNRYCIGGAYAATTADGIVGDLTTNSLLVGTSGQSGSWGSYPFVIAAPASRKLPRQAYWF